MKPRLLTSALAALLLLLAAGCAATSGQTVAPSASGHTTAVEQDPKLRITTQQLMDLFAKEYGNTPLIEETLEQNNSFLLIDTRPAVRFNEGTIPGSINIPTPRFAQDIPELPRDRTLIFYCGGLACPFTPEATAVAQEHGFTNIRAYYEGEPGWSQAGNYLITDISHVQRLVEASDRENFVLIDARPPRVHQGEHIPGSISIPWVLFEQKKGLLPADRDLPLIFYCGGHHCDLSHNAAQAALELGYTKVFVYSAGVPAWKKADLPLWGYEAAGVEMAEVDPDALPETITPEEFMTAVKAGDVALVDVRSEREFAEGHIPGAINIPDGKFYEDLEGALAKLPTDRRVIVVCATGARSGGVFFMVSDIMLDEPELYSNPHGVQYLNRGIEYAADGTFTVK